MITVRKANGKFEPYSQEKLYRSLQRARVSKDHQHQLVKQIESRLYDGIPTRSIYSQISQTLQEQEFAEACSYNLKQGIMKLGPTGYPFEKYVASILEHQGYSTQTSQMVQGKCVAHEVDVIATKPHERYMVECKFHNQSGMQSDVKVALYVQARFQDVTWRWSKENTAPEYHAMLVTNTRCSSDAIAYAECVNMTILGWGYPEKGNLQDLIESQLLYPVTTLCSLKNEDAARLIEQGVITIHDLLQKQNVIDELIPHSHTRNVILRELRSFEERFVQSQPEK